MEREKLIATVTAAQQGDSDALSTLFNAFYNDVYYFALKTVKDDDLACDITQEAFVEIINTIGNLQEPAAFVKWMKQITYHQCTRYFKKKKEVLVDEDEEGNTIFDTLKEEKTEFIPDEALDQQDFRDTILAMLDELSEEQRSATMLYYYDELSVKQIAEIQGVSEGTVKSRLNYARKSIKNSVEDYEKKNGVKLHCAGVLPLLLWLLSQTGKETMPVAAANAVASGVTTATGVTVSVAAVSTGGAAVATATVATTAASGVGIAAKIAALPVVTKVVAGVVAGSLVFGGVGLAVLPEKDPATTDPTVTTAPSDTSPTHTEDTQPSTEETLPLETTVPTTDNTETTIPNTDPIETQPATNVTEPIETRPTTNVTKPIETRPTTNVTEPIETQPGTETTEPSNSTVSRNYVPIGCTYTTADGTILNAGDAMPETGLEGDIFTTEDYTYTYGSGGWAVQVNDTTKTAYGSLLSTVNDAPVTSMQKAFFGCSNLVSAPEIPGTILNMQSAFYDCTSLTQAPTIPEGVTDMSYVFRGCTKLKTAPVLPSTVTTLDTAFYNCTALTQAPVIPASVTNLRVAFYGCKLLTQAPVIPTNVTNMEGTFYGCTALVAAPQLPAGVTTLKSTFYNCSALAAAPVIPEKVTDMTYTFYGCTSLTEAPVIPDSVTMMYGTFIQCTSLRTGSNIPVNVVDAAWTYAGCTALTGTITMDANPTSYSSCFANTQKTITLVGSSTMLAELAATGNNGNVTVQIAE